jgi:UDP-GlcNAc:undecaprenyl-phosphate GlcNAc-1-phosphate transferase
MVWSGIAFIFSSFTSLLLIHQAERWGFLDLPQARKIHVLPTPRTGGLAVACAGAATLALRLAWGHPWPPLPWQTWVAGGGFLAVGALDDRFEFHPRRKFLWFLALALLAAWPWAFTGPAGSAYAAQVGPWGVQAPRWMAYLLLTFWFLAVPNAVNIEDAINGYMGGFTLILLGVAAWQGVDLAIPMGALAAFLVLNWPKAKHFLGDAGSFGCGFLIAEALLRAGGGQRPCLALVLTAPISMDVGIGIVRRLRLNMTLFQADRATCPHHLRNLCNQSQTWATLVLWTNAAIIAILAFQPAVLGAGYLSLFALALVPLNRAPLFRPRNQPLQDLRGPG